MQRRLVLKFHCGTALAVTDCHLYHARTVGSCKCLCHVHTKHESCAIALACRIAIYETTVIVHNLFADKQAHADSFTIHRIVNFVLLQLSKE